MYVQRRNVDNPKWLDEVLTKSEILENWIMSLDEKVLAKEQKKTIEGLGSIYAMEDHVEFVQLKKHQSFFLHCKAGGIKN